MTGSEPDEALFALVTGRIPAGRVRKGLEDDLRAARATETDLSAAGIALLRSLADQIDQLERQLRAPDARPYDRIPLSGMVRQFDETYGRVFRTDAGALDPLARALEAFAASETRDPAEPFDPE